MLYNIILNNLKLQETYLIKVCSEIKQLPNGSLIYSVRGTKKYYFQSTFHENSRKKTYLGTFNGKQSQMISDLKRKRVLLGCKKVLEENVVALRACLSKYQEFDPTQISGRLAASYEGISDASIESKPMDELDWQHSPYPRAEMFSENLKHEAIGGLMVRSKSEALIAFALDLARIPFHYEEILELQNKKIAPDFTILHPRTRERVYWEHFGMMDDSAYASETYRKLIAYGQNDILPGKNLIFTMETDAEPLSIREIQGMIEHYFLS